MPQAKRIMPNGDYAVRLLRRFRPRYRLIFDRESAARWEQTTRSKEGSHLVHLLPTLPLAAYLLVVGAFIAAAAVAMLDIAFDLYPILVQRHNRMRIRNLLRARRLPTSG